jgi:hypothetical protein
MEHIFAWIARHRCTVRDDERLPDHHPAVVTWAMITVMTRWLARQRHPAAPQPQASSQGSLQFRNSHSDRANAVTTSGSGLTVTDEARPLMTGGPAHVGCQQSSPPAGVAVAAPSDRYVW